MAVRTLAELEAALDDSLSWRRIEIGTIKSNLDSAYSHGPHSPLTRALARSGIAMLYAHWEGFARDAFGAYVDFLARRKLKVSELNDGLARTVFDALSRRLASGDEAATVLLLEAIRSPNSARAAIPKSSMANTKSNLRSKVLMEILSSVGLDHSEFETKAQLIDRTLCDARNEIAHGRDNFPTADQFTELRDEVLPMMETIRHKIIAAARAGDYRVSTNP